MRVLIEPAGEELSSFAPDVRSLLEEHSLHPSSVLVVRNGVLVTEDEPLLPDDEVRLLRVMSGG
ncbi:MoaD/ThiS family protein [Candidatus Woesearchaeota archaeon]|nr:MoaD/ThiS family protein [Candidatus Woesearchaeota archaeon]